MQPNLKFRNRGFTLIETLIYSAITTLFLTAALLMIYQMISSLQRGKNERELVENQKVLEQKIYWALQSVSAINSPAANATTTSLSVNRLNYGSNPILIDMNGGVARITKGAGAATPVTNTYSDLQSMTFHQYSWDGRPAIRVQATLVNHVASTSVSIDTTIITK